MGCLLPLAIFLLYTSVMAAGETCDVGFFGETCRQHCPDNCEKNQCHSGNGSCLHGCKKGFWGDQCENGCNTKCRHERCDRESGSCSEGCSPGYYGPKCILECSARCHHHICDRNGGNCTLRCQDGFFGDKCQNSCDTGCCACSPDFGQCLLDDCPEQKKHPCFVMTVVMVSCGGLLTCIISAIVIYKSCRRKPRKPGSDQKRRITKRPPIDLPGLSQSQGTVNHYDMIRDEYSSFQGLSKSMSNIDELSTARRIKHPDKCRSFLRTKMSQYMSPKRRLKSLSASDETTDTLPSCWIGKGQGLLELFSTVAEGENDGQAGQECGTEGSSTGVARVKPEVVPSKRQSGAISVQSGKTEAKKGYISAIFDNCEVDKILLSTGKQEAIPE